MQVSVTLGVIPTHHKDAVDVRIGCPVQQFGQRNLQVRVAVDCQQPVRNKRQRLPQYAASAQFLFLNETDAVSRTDRRPDLAGQVVQVDESSSAAQSAQLPKLQGDEGDAAEGEGRFGLEKGERLGPPAVASARIKNFTRERPYGPSARTGGTTGNRNH